MNDDAKLIDKLGGTNAVASALKKKPSAVKKWRQRRIPLEHRRKIRDLAAEHGITLTDKWIWQAARAAWPAPSSPAGRGRLRDP